MGVQPPPREQHEGQTEGRPRWEQSTKSTGYVFMINGLTKERWETCCEKLKEGGCVNRVKGQRANIESVFNKPAVLPPPSLVIYNGESA